MNLESNKKLDFISKFSEFEKVNSELTKCKCYMLASGDNANGSDITDEAIDKAIARGEFFNKPVVAHLYKDEDSNRYRVGGHDSTWIISAEGIEMVDECIPFGTIPESANIHKEEVLEPDGITKNTYLVCDIILWTGRYNIMDAAYSDSIYFNQSCELSVNDYHYKSNNILAIDDFTFSALCLLNKSDDKEKNVRPCFPSCRVEKYEFSLVEDKLKRDFEQLLARVKQYESDSKKSVSHTQNDRKGEMLKMDFSKILERLSDIKIENSETPKYALVSVGDNSIGVIDREDYKVYSIGCTIDNDEVIIDFENRTECRLDAVALVEGEQSFDLNAEINAVKEFVKSEVEASISTTYAESYNGKIQELTEKFESLSNDYDSAMAELEKFRAADKEAKAVENKNKVDEVVSKFEAQMGRNASFLIWKAKLDYSKVTPEDVDKELTMMLGEIAVKGEFEGKKKSFGYQPISCGVQAPSGKTIYSDSERYGDLFSKVMKFD